MPKDKDADTLPDLFPAPPPAAEVLPAMRELCPHLDRICKLHTDDLPALKAGRAAEVLEEARREFLSVMDSSKDEDRVSKAIRHYRMRANHAVAITDFLHLSGVEDHMEWLSATAEQVVDATARWICRQSPVGEKANDRWFILALGKLGSHELNYSSDIDLVIITLPELMEEDERESAEFIRMTRRLVSLLSKPTQDGIGWRVDLRLRPDPGATPIAIRMDAALMYYESMARTWERSAFIRSRVVGGNRSEGDEFLRSLAPFIWRRSLDFAALEDMRVMLRREHRGPDLLGFNVKNGLGGIRSIEFFAHVQQLIAGGREPALRVRRTDDALAALAAGGWISEDQARRLTTAYKEWRRLEHRLQMVGDAQTHQLPKSEEAMDGMAALCSHPDTASFRRAVHALGDQVVEDTMELLERIGSSPDDATDPLLEWIQDRDQHPDKAVDALKELGFKHPENIVPVCEGWMAGRIRALSSERTQAIMARLLPRLLRQFSEHENPDALFSHFAQLLDALPAGAQLLSLLEGNTGLAATIITVFANVPKQAATLIRHPEVLDSMMYNAFWEAEHDWGERRSQLEEALERGRDHEDHLNILRRVCREWEFQTATHMLTRSITAEQAGQQFTLIAETAIQCIIPHVAAHMEDAYGAMDVGGIAVLALGRLGAGSMTVESDLDLIFVYDAPDDSESKGPKPVGAKVWYPKFGQQLINALTASTSEGRCYAVDMRLRPSGNAGPVAVQADGFRQYHEEKAWLWEHMALIKARVVGGLRHEPLVPGIETAIETAIGKPRQPASIRAEVADMRKKLASSHPPQSAFDLRHLEGGLMDLDFLAQMLQLMPEAEGARRIGQAWRALPQLAKRGMLPPERADSLERAGTTLNAMQHWLRLTDADPEETGSLPKPVQDEFDVGTPAEFGALIKSQTDTVKAALESELARK